MDKKLQGSNFGGDSYHGGALSLSPCPADWAAVLKTKAPLLEFQNPSHQLLSFESISVEEGEHLNDWAEAKGYAKIEQNPYPPNGPLYTRRFVHLTDAFYKLFPDSVHGSICNDRARYLAMAFANIELGLDGVLFEKTERIVDAETLPTVPGIGIFERALNARHWKFFHQKWKYFKCEQPIDEARGTMHTLRVVNLI
ncbi:hypothetical protein [Rhodoferax sp. TS-BS-61-7]|uniref:hypothetical protein n=1 Tax=Rhodoferax sp. TS-BS-61-7 TaxID=2094194 RepID=UPI000CF64E83|nr:hypothetical protein [Rhodoferax sp. TS-BS-61-7]PQA78059.1 hypothetical protein C5F53_06910 [Rhodoferax sp. TS-BS-61-7]